jgi:hypothetical protein
VVTPSRRRRRELYSSAGNMVRVCVALGGSLARARAVLGVAGCMLQLQHVM